MNLADDAPLFLSFASGSITYDCQPCGRCCRGLGFGLEPDQAAHSAPLRKLGAFTAGHDGILYNVFTYADGCRYLGEDNLCDLHRGGGPEAKPKICRLFPFSRLVNVGGMWAVLPHGSCPWTASEAPDPLSRHDAILAELDPKILPALSPAPIHPLTEMEPDARFELETQIRDATHLAAEPAAALSAVREIYAEAGLPASPAPPLVLWLDLLRSAGPPPKLSPDAARLFVVTLPTVRLEWCEYFTHKDLPLALEAFELWLRTLHELGGEPKSGDDILRLAESALPVVHIMTHSMHPVPEIEVPQGLSPQMELTLVELREHVGEPLGESLLVSLRAFEQGALTVLAELGEQMMVKPNR